MLSPYKDNFRVTSIQRPDRNIGGVIAPHNGIDLVGINKNIYAVSDGKVVISSLINRSTGNTAWKFGNRITILDKNGKYVMYNHLNARYVFTGQVVKAGQLIGKEGWTGYVVPVGPRGSHLHFEIRDRLGLGYKNFSAAEYLGIPNEIHNYKKEDFSINIKPSSSTDIEEGDKVKVINTVTINNIVKGYTYNGGYFTIFYETYDVISAPKGSERIVIGIGKTITAAVNIKNLQKI